MSLHIHPKGRRVLIKPDPIEEETESGIIVVTDKKLEKAGQMRGTVADFGDLAWKGFEGDEDEEPWAQIGDWILYSRYAGKTVEDPITEEDYVILNDEDVLAVLDRKQ